MAIIYWWASCRWTNLDGGATAEHSSTLHWVLNRNLRHQTLLSGCDESTPSERRPPGQHPSLSLPPFPLQSPIAPLNSSFLLPDSCRRLCHFLLIYSSAFLQTVLVPAPLLLLSLCFRALRRSRLFLFTLRLQSFISYYFLDQTHSLTFYIFPSSSCFPSCAWPFPPRPPLQTLPPLRQCVSSLACSPEDKRLADPLIHLVGSIIHLSDQPTACVRANTNTNA